ncbi:unnamed protein product, partial [Pylaiella littoralis]
ANDNALPSTSGGDNGNIAERIPSTSGGTAEFARVTLPVAVNSSHPGGSSIDAVCQARSAGTKRRLAGDAGAADRASKHCSQPPLLPCPAFLATPTRTPASSTDSLTTRAAESATPKLSDVGKSERNPGDLGGKVTERYFAESGLIPGDAASTAVDGNAGGASGAGSQTGPSVASAPADRAVAHSCTGANIGQMATATNESPRLWSLFVGLECNEKVKVQVAMSHQKFVAAGKDLAKWTAKMPQVFTERETQEWVCTFPVSGTDPVKVHNVWELCSGKHLKQRVLDSKAP